MARNLIRLSRQRRPARKPAGHLNRYVEPQSANESIVPSCDHACLPLQASVCEIRRSRQTLLMVTSGSRLDLEHRCGITNRSRQMIADWMFAERRLAAIAAPEMPAKHAVHLLQSRI